MTASSASSVASSKATTVKSSKRTRATKGSARGVQPSMHGLPSDDSVWTERVDGKEKRSETPVESAAGAGNKAGASSTAPRVRVQVRGGGFRTTGFPRTNPGFDGGFHGSEDMEGAELSSSFSAVADSPFPNSPGASTIASSSVTFEHNSRVSSLPLI